MTNEQLGEALIDAVIPSIISSTQLAGVAFYDSSPIGMIFFFCVIFGIICYKIFILRPATVLVAHRCDKLKKIELKGPSFRGVHPLRNAKSSNGNFDDLTQYLKRIFKLFRHSLQHGLSGSSRRMFMTRLARHHETIKSWGQMNLPSSSQGVIRFQYESTLNRKNSPYQRCTSAYVPPIEIMRMIRSVRAVQTHSKAADNLNFSNVLIERNEPVITKSDIKVQTKKCFTPFIYLDPDILIASLRSTLLLKSGDIDEGFLEVTVDDLHNEFRISLQTFYPNGVIMSEMEQTEASELFSSWKETQDQHFSIVYCDNVCSSTRMINFENFEKWFMNDLVLILENNISNRLLDHTIRLSPCMRKRISTTAASYNDDSSPLRRQYFIPRLDMKGLNTLSPESFTDRSDVTPDDPLRFNFPRYINDSIRRDPTMRRNTVSLTSTPRRRSHQQADSNDILHDSTMRRNTVSLTSTPRRRSHQQSIDNRDGTSAKSASDDMSPQRLHELVLARLNAEEPYNDSTMRRSTESQTSTPRRRSHQQADSNDILHDSTMRRNTVSLTSTPRRRSHQQSIDNRDGTSAKSASDDMSPQRLHELVLARLNAEEPYNDSTMRRSTESQTSTPRRRSHQQADSNDILHDSTMRRNTVSLTSTPRRRSHQPDIDNKGRIQEGSPLTSREVTPRDVMAVTVTPLVVNEVVHDVIPPASMMTQQKPSYEKNSRKKHARSATSRLFESPSTSGDVSPRESREKSDTRYAGGDTFFNTVELRLTSTSIKTSTSQNSSRHDPQGRTDRKIGSLESLSRRSNVSPERRTEAILARLK